MNAGSERLALSEYAFPLASVAGVIGASVSLLLGALSIHHAIMVVAVSATLVVAALAAEDRAPAR